MGNKKRVFRSTAEMVQIILQDVLNKIYFAKHGVYASAQ
jgi:hypothetical protein